MVEALGKMAKVHAHQGSVSFRNEDQARDFAEEMKERYGASVLKDMAAGRTDALAKDGRFARSGSAGDLRLPDGSAGGKEQGAGVCAAGSGRDAVRLGRW